MRCPHCDNALVTIVKDGPRVWIGFAGVHTLHLTVPTSADGDERTHSPH